METNQNKPAFYEEQRFRQKWLLVLLSLVSAITLITLIYSLYKQLYLKEPFGKNPMSDEGLIISSFVLLAFIIGLNWLFIKMKLITIVNDNYLKIIFNPFLKKEININEIEIFKPVIYNPIKEFGGWGMRYSWKERKRAYNVYGNKGVDIQLQNGERLLLGSQKPEELAAAIKTIKNRY